jgi:hypothetical protein
VMGGSHNWTASPNCPRGAFELPLWDRMCLNDAIDSMMIPYTTGPILRIDSTETRIVMAEFIRTHQCEMKIDRLHRVLIVPHELAGK